MDHTISLQIILLGELGKMDMKSLILMLHVRIFILVLAVRLVASMENHSPLDDAMAEIKAKILMADMPVFVTPLYYFGMSAQLKMCLDRCCSINRQVTEKHMKSALLASAWNKCEIWR